jgi:hypothetical protein
MKIAFNVLRDDRFAFPSAVFILIGLVLVGHATAQGTGNAGTIAPLAGYSFPQAGATSGIVAVAP